MNMREWLKNIIGGNKKPLPILSYPGAALLGMTAANALESAESQARVMKAVAQRCDSAAAVTLMDLSVEAECFGAEIVSDGGVPAVTGELVTDFESAEKLRVPKPGEKRSGIFIDAVKEAKKLITDRPVFAGAAAPFSLAARLIGITDIMFMCYDEPETVECVLKKCTEFVIDYIKAMKAAGADGVILAEPVAGLLSPALEEEFSAPFTKAVAEAVKDDEFIVVYHNCGQGVVRMADSIFANGCDAYHFGNAVDLRELLAAAPTGVPVMGNIDPVALFRDGTPEEMTAAVGKLREECGGYDNFVLSSGCDIPFDAKWENIDAFFNA